MIASDGVFIVNSADESFVNDVQKRHTRSLINTAALSFDNPVFDLVAHTEAVATTNFISERQYFKRRLQLLSVNCNRSALLKTDADLLGLDSNALIPELNSHNWFND